MKREISRNRIFGFFLILCSCSAPVSHAIAQTDECSLENAVYIETVVSVAMTDAGRAGLTPQAQQTAQDEVNKALVNMPLSCNNAFNASQTAELANLCAPSTSVVLSRGLQAILPLTGKYAATGNREAYFNGVRAVMRQVLMTVPRQCWFAPVPSSRPVPSPGQVSGPNAQCYQCQQEFQQCTVRTRGRGPCSPCMGCP